ncbi:MAG TPA: ATP-grasp domain-containing protein [Thermoclostridium sp.]|nr:ATP-grasp domain-containing protein [Thermoclostridium sp.]
MSEVPRGSGYRVGITFNLKQEKENEQEDEQAEYDSIGTIESISKALKKTGCEIYFIEAGTKLPEKLIECSPDIIFNIAEGKGGRGREAQVPSILNYYSMPFTGSDETTLCIALDKGLTKRLVRSCNIKTPVFFVWKGESTTIPSNLRFPVILKPNAEGSSKGVLGNMIARSRKELHEILHEKWNRYHQPILIEEYIAGREFTVGILGNGGEKRIFRPMEIVISPNGNPDGSKVYSFHVKKNYKEYVQYKCPAILDLNIEQKMIQYSKKIYEMLECRDFARIDFMLSDSNDIYFIEINPLPGLAPGYSDYPMLAEYNGLGYDELIKCVLNNGLRRYGMSAV